MTDLAANRELRRPTLSDAALLLVIGVTWGSSFLPIKIAVYETGPVLLVYLRTLAGLAPLLMFMVWRGISFPRGRHDWFLLIVMSILNPVLPFFLLSWAGLHIDSSVMALIMGAAPLLTLVVAHITTHDDKLNFRKFAGMMLGMGGLIFIVGPDAVGGLTASLFGDLAVFGAIACFVLATSIVRKLRTAAKEAIATCNMLIGAILLTPLVLAVDVPSVTELSWKSIAAILYLGAVNTGVGYVVRYHLVMTVGQSFTSMASYIMPIVGVGLGFMFLGEPVSVNIAVALVLVLIGFTVARSGT